MLHISCNMCACDLPVMYALACGPQASGIHIRQFPDALVAIYICTYICVVRVGYYK